MLWDIHLLNGFAEFCNMCASGLISRDVGPFMLAANLLNLLQFRKEGGSMESGRKGYHEVKHSFLNVISPLGGKYYSPSVAFDKG